MAKAKPKENEPIKHDIAITVGGVALLKQTLGSPGWYEGEKSIHLFPAITLNEHLAGVKIPDGDGAAAEKALEKAHTIRGVSEAQRDAAKACIEFYIKKAAFAPTPHLATLCAQLGIEG